MVPPHNAAFGVHRQVARRKHILPTPMPACIGILSCKGFGQINSSVSLLHVLIMHLFYGFQVGFQRAVKKFGKQGHSVLVSLSGTDNRREVAEIKVIDPQPDALGHPYTAGVNQLQHKAFRTRKVGKNPLKFILGQHYRNASVLPCPYSVPKIAELLAQHIPIKEKQRIKCLVLGGCRHLPFYGQDK